MFATIIPYSLLGMGKGGVRRKNMSITLSQILALVGKPGFTMPPRETSCVLFITGTQKNPGHGLSKRHVG
jgi:hypothetical protein